MNTKEKAQFVRLATENEQLKTRIGELVTVLELSVRYLEHPEVKAIPFALNPDEVVRRARNAMRENPNPRYKEFIRS